MFPILLGKNNDLEKRVKTLEDSGGGGSSGDGVLIVTDNDGTLDKTWQEIHDSAFSVLKSSDGTISFCSGVYNDNEGIAVTYWTAGAPEAAVYVTDSTSGYPTLI